MKVQTTRQEFWASASGLRHSARRAAVALLLVLWALFLLTMVVFALVQQVDQQIFLDTRGNAEREARAMAFSGLQIALHPAITNNAPAILRGGTDARHEYAAQLRGEGGKLNLGWLIQGETPARLDLLRRYLEGRGLGFAERETFIDCLLDWVDPDDLVRANGAETDVLGRKVPNRPLADLGELRRMKGAGPLLELPDWDRDFTLWTNANPGVDLRWASEEVLAALPGVGAPRARTFVQLRRGPDGLDGTADDREIRNQDEALALLGLGPQERTALNGFVTFNSPVYRIVAEGRAGDVRRTIEVIVAKNNGQGQILQWQER